MIYFGADWHLYHKNILNLCERPFDNIESMKLEFLAEWRAKITDEDTVFLLGDISFSNKAIDDMVDLPGNKILIKGNHDPSKFSSNRDLWNEALPYLEIKNESYKLVLMHFPIEAWNGMEYGAIHLHGHTHNNTSRSISNKINRIDVGYDHTFQALISFQEVLERLTKTN